MNTLFWIGYSVFQKYNPPWICIFKRTKHRRLEDCFNDIPDSDPDSDDVDHPLEKAGYLSKREINQILAVKIKKLKELYKAELNAVNNDLIRYTVRGKIVRKHFDQYVTVLFQGGTKWFKKHSIPLFEAIVGRKWASGCPNGKNKTKGDSFQAKGKCSHTIILVFSFLSYGPRDMEHVFELW